MAIKKYHVSKNLWEYTIEQGGWFASSGTIPVKVPSDNPANYRNRCRVDSIVAIPNMTLSLTCGNNVKINYVWIDNNGYSMGGSGYQYNGDTVTAPNGAVSMTFILGKNDDSDCTPNDFTNIMLVAGSTPLPYEPYGNTWNSIPYRKYGTETDTLTTLPKTIIGDGTAISAYTIKGNMSQSGTPTPTNPIYPTECGDKTANLYNYITNREGYRIVWSTGADFQDATAIMSDYIPVTTGNYYLSMLCIIVGYGENKEYIGVYNLLRQ